MKNESTMIEKETVVAMSKVAQKISQARSSLPNGRLLPLDLVEVKELLDDCQEIMAYHCDCAPAQLIEGQVDIIMGNQEGTRKKYLVDVCRTSYGVKTLEIEANSPEEAQELALDQAGNHEYSEKESEYTCQGCISSSRALDAFP